MALRLVYDYAKNGLMKETPILSDIHAKLSRPIVLIGLMGAGKTKLGQMLAEALSLPFVDADDVIVARAGLSIPEIFSRHGEPRFRALEADVMKDLISGAVQIISTGGGAVMTPGTADRVFSDQVISIWIKAPLSEHVTRTSARQGDRPLLSDSDPEAKLQDLLTHRSPVYARANLQVENGHQTPQASLRVLLDALHAYLYTQAHD